MQLSATPKGIDALPATFAEAESLRAVDAVRLMALVMIGAWIQFAAVDPFVTNRPLAPILTLRLSLLVVLCILRTLVNHPRIRPSATFMGQVFIHICTLGISALVALMGDAQIPYHDEIALSLVGYAAFVPTTNARFLMCAAVALVGHNAVLWSLHTPGDWSAIVTQNAALGLCVAGSFAFLVWTRALRQRDFESHQRILRIREREIQMAAQIGHDIRSPLAAMEVAMQDLANPSEETRSLLRHAVRRVQDIANQLLLLNPAKVAGSQDGMETAAPVLLSSLIDSIVSEKRITYRPRLDLTIESNTGPDNYGLFAHLRPADFKRILSNLINNAAEAIEGAGSVRVLLSDAGTHVRVRVCDTGKGMAPAQLTALGQAGVGSRKANGHGMGVSSAMQGVASWGGTLSFASQLGQGTQVTLLLPKCPEPAWFLRRLSLVAGSTVVILDDDASIHEVWRSRLTEQVLVHLSTAEAFRAWMASCPRQQRVLCLIDQELLGGRVTGLELIAALQLEGRSVLVTSHFDEPAVVQSCLRLGIKMVPKPVAGYLPVDIAAASGTPSRAVLIDDDLLVHRVWALSAAEAGVDLQVFPTAAEFFACAAQLPRDVALYIDLDLGPGVRGDDVAHRARALGFTRIHVSTGHPGRQAFAHMPWLCAVIDKKPPFG